MKIAVIGAGGVGGTYGAALAKAGEEVTFVARGAHLAAMQANGLRVEGGRETMISPVHATDNIASVGPVDIVLLCTKLWDLETAARQLGPLLGPETGVIPVQNGVDATERLAGVVGPAAAMSGTVLGGGVIERPGVITQVGAYMGITFGESHGRITARAERFLAACQRAEFDATLSTDIAVPIWMKFIGFVALSGATTLSRQPIGVLREDADGWELLVDLMRETEAVGRAEGVALPTDAVQRIMALGRSIPPERRGSMAIDLERGNRLELPWLAGKVVALGRKHATPTPVNRTVYAALKPFANGKPNIDPR